MWFDHGFLINSMRAVREFLHYRIVDISSVKELARWWLPHIEPQKKLAHRALDDIYESIEEARMYKNCIFKV